MYILSKYGLAFHLALLCAVSVFLASFPSGNSGVAAVLCLCAIAWEWAVVEPSVRLKETRSDARRRTFEEIAKDPVFWILAASLAFSLVRWLNAGVEFVYSVRAARWAVEGPRWEGMPTAVDAASGARWFAIAATLATAVPIARHALGAKARTAFSLCLAFIAGICGWVAVAFACAGSPIARDAALADMFSSPSYGVSFGLCALLGMAGAQSAAEYRWKAAPYMAGIGLSGCMACAAVFSPPQASYVLAGVFAVPALYAMFRCGSSVSLVSFVRAFIVATVSAGAVFVALFSVPGAAAAKLEQSASKAAEMDAAAKAAVSGISSGLWKNGRDRWTGCGDGAFGVRAKEYVAGLQDGAERNRLWKPLPVDIERTRPAGFFAGFTLEHGIIGLMFLIAVAVVIAAEWCFRAVKAFAGYERKQEDPPAIMGFSSIAFVFPFALAAFVLCSRYGMMGECAALVPLALSCCISAGSFPKSKKKAAVKATYEEKEVSNG